MWLMHAENVQHTYKEAHLQYFTSDELSAVTAVYAKGGVVAGLTVRLVLPM